MDIDPREGSWLGCTSLIGFSVLLAGVIYGSYYWIITESHGVFFR